ncbi:hypothetical protein [Archangium sp.]|jgi:hypothetical protein|uniref:hypothetical protein n=1 Tax=Archangium sp. TaxID=1872627 RepID=UPI002EDB6279
MEQESRPAVRVLSLLFSVVVVGGLIGFGSERLTYAEPLEPLDALEQALPEEAAPAPARRTAEEEALLRRALSHFPPYPRGGRPEVLAADYLGPGVPIAVAWFSTEDPPERVLTHYRDTLLAQGLPVLGDRSGENAGYVGYWSPATEEVYLVSVLAQGGETLVFVSSGQMKPLLEGPSKVPEWIPLPADAEETLALTFLMEGSLQHTVSGRVPEGTVPEVAGFFRRAFSERGWSVEEPRPTEEAMAELEVRRGGVRGRVMLRRTLPRAEVDIHLSLTERPEPPHEAGTEEASR